jgi:P4 family phage/plasmid primase-like protien
MNDSVLQCAQCYLEDYGFIPIPVRKTRDEYTDQNGRTIAIERKAPLGQGWQTTTAEDALAKINHQARLKLKYKAEGINLGILTGKPSGIFVIDIDKKDGGLEAWEKLTQDIDYETMSQSTPSGGKHFIYKYEERLDAFTGRSKAILLDGKQVGIDFRTTGNQIVVAPSEYDGKSYSLDFEAPIASMSDGLYQVLLQHLSDSQPPETRPINGLQNQFSLTSNPKELNSNSNSNSIFISDYLEKSPPKKETVKSMIALLNPSRADSYDSWIKVGLLLHNLSTDYLDLWMEFSKQSPKHDTNSCTSQWAMMKTKETGLNIGTLHHWLKEDNPNDYDDLFPSSQTLPPEIKGTCQLPDDPTPVKVRLIRKNPLVSAYEVSTESRLAEALLHMFPNQFKSSNANNDRFWRFENHRWKKIPDSVIINLIRYDLQRALTDIHKAQPQKVKAKKGSEDLELIERGNNIIRLETISMKEKIFKELHHRVCDPQFLSKLDQNKHLLGFEDGVYDLNAQQFRDGKPEDYVSLSVGYNFPRNIPEDHQTVVSIYRLLGSIFPDPLTRDYVLLCHASCLHGENPHEQFFIQYGPGGNGKSRLDWMIEHALGEYAGKAPYQIISQMEKSGESATPQLAKLKGLRYVKFSEPPTNWSVNATMKDITGNDKITVRELYGKPFDFYAQFKPYVSTNSLPDLTSTYNDQGTWRRLNIVPFKVSFVDTPNPENKYEAQRDSTLETRQSSENWHQFYMYILLEYYASYVKAGKKLIKPPEVLEATKSFKASCDHIQEFIDEHLTETKEEKDYVKASEIWDAYADWQGKDKKLLRKKLLDEVSRKTKCPFSRIRAKAVDIRQALTGWKLTEEVS